MPDTSPLTDAVDRLADRLRAMPHSALARGAAAEGLGLARELARRAQAVEFPRRVPRELPDAGPFAVGDQLAVAGHDLAAALSHSGTDPERAAEELADALAVVGATTLTGRR